MPELSMPNMVATHKNYGVHHMVCHRHCCTPCVTQQFVARNCLLMDRGLCKLYFRVISAVSMYSSDVREQGLKKTHHLLAPIGFLAPTFCYSIMFLAYQVVSPGYFVCLVLYCCWCPTMIWVSLITVGCFCWEVSLITVGCFCWDVHEVAHPLCTIAQHLAVMCSELCKIG